MNNHKTWKSFIDFETKRPYFKTIKNHLISDNAEGKNVLPEPKQEKIRQIKLKLSVMLILV